MKLKEIFEPKCIHRHTARTHPKCFGEDGKPIKSLIPKDAKTLIFDIETLPIVAYTWQVWNVNINRQQIIKDWCILSWSAKWLGDDKIISDVLTPKESITRNDKRLVTSFWKLIDSADVVIVQNGKKFDIKKMNSRFWKHGLKRPSSYKVIDTFTTAKSVFGLTYNSQDFIAEYIGAQEKLGTNFELWKDCDNGNPQALKYMLDYNENDVRGLEQIYMEMRDWIPNHPDLRLYSSGDSTLCPVCLGGNSEDLEFYVAYTKKYKEHRCKDCGSVWHDSKCEKE